MLNLVDELYLLKARMAATLYQNQKPGNRNDPSLRCINRIEFSFSCPHLLS